MAKVTYDASGDIPETINAPIGTYRAEIIEAEAGESSKGNEMTTIRWKLTHSADGKKITEDYWPVRLHLMTADERAYAKRAIKEFVQALGLPLKGSLDTAKLVGKKAQLKLKTDTDQDGEYQPRIGKVLPLGGDTPEVEEPAEEPAAEPEEEEIDLDKLDRAALKKLIKEEQLGSLADLGITTKTTDDEIRGIILGLLSAEPEDGEDGEAEPEPEPEEEEPEGEAEGDNYDELSLADLKKEFKDRELDAEEVKSLKGAKLKAALVQALRDDDGAEPF